MRYIEVNSTYRNRSIWPYSSEFEIPISQTGLMSNNTALDPVCNAMPVFAWSSNNLIIGGGASISAPAIIENANPLQYSSDTLTFVISTTSPLQQLKNYYRGLILIDTSGANNVYRRIFSYLYLGSYLVLGTPTYRAQITVNGQFSDNFAYGNGITISDPTDFSDPAVPVIFVPNGPIQENAFASYVLYNETINQYRPIKKYEGLTGLLILDTSGSATATSSSGPIDGSWATTNNFSLRESPPEIPSLNTVNQTVVSISGSTMTSTFGAPMSQVADYYKNYFIRFLPYVSGDTKYEFNPTPSNKTAYRVTSYTPNSPTDATFSVYPPFEPVPEVNSAIELFPISYDNFNPFVYTGSLVSQQDMVCYSVRLSSLTVPNAVLYNGQGGRAALYPFLYVELSNVSASGAGLKNIIYSNNPNVTSVIFRVPVYDIQNPLTTPYVRVTGDMMPQVIKFKPNDNLFFKVTLPNGDIFDTILGESFSPAMPNLYNQITALFGFDRI